MSESLKITKACPICEKPMVVRTNKASGQDFLGCSQYPDCTGTAPLPPEVLLRAAGAPTLPGFE